MRIHRILLSLLLILLGFNAVLQAQPEVTNSGGLFYVKLIDGLNGVLMPQPQATNTEITFSVKIGSMYESDSLSGISNLVATILNKKVNDAIKNSKATLSVQNVIFSGISTTERGIYKFTTSPQNLDACLMLFRDSVFNAKISIADIEAARNNVLQQIENAKHDKNKLFDDRMLRGLYVQDHQKFEVLGSAKTLKDFDRLTIINYFKKYYVPNNTFLTITGALQSQAVEESMARIFKSVVKSEFNPETVTKIIDLRPMAYNTQFIIDDTTGVPEFQICWQFPGTNNNFHDSYCAFLLNAILSDKNNYIQAKAIKLGCKKFDIQYDANNFYGILKVTVQPSKQNFYPTYQFVMTELSRLNKTLINDIMISAGKIQFKREYEYIHQTTEYPKRVVKYWTFNDDSYYATLLDSVMAVTPKVMQDFIIDYFDQSAHITGLKISKADRDALKVDSVFTDLDQSVAKYVFTYKQNSTTVEGADNTLKLQNLLQWLTINPDINIQVNGFSDEHEYNRTTDEDSIIDFIDSMPTFSRVTSDIIKKKRTIRPELARAAKIVRYLYDHGIAADRLNGTAMMYSSSNKKEAEDNMKCTLTLNKQRKSPSLFEYHFGRKKE